MALIIFFPTSEASIWKSSLIVCLPMSFVPNIPPSHSVILRVKMVGVAGITNASNHMSIID